MEPEGSLPHSQKAAATLNRMNLLHTLTSHILYNLF
jgi:hypothetical protein